MGLNPPIFNAVMRSASLPSVVHGTPGVVRAYVSPVNSSFVRGRAILVNSYVSR